MPAVTAFNTLTGSMGSVEGGTEGARGAPTETYVRQPSEQVVSLPRVPDEIDLFESATGQKTDPNARKGGLNWRIELFAPGTRFALGPAGKAGSSVAWVSDLRSEWIASNQLALDWYQFRYGKPRESKNQLLDLQSGAWVGTAEAFPLFVFSARLLSPAIGLASEVADQPAVGIHSPSLTQYYLPSGFGLANQVGGARYIVKPKVELLKDSKP
jgi:hypothetical protein